jgi:hypothetical protein
MNSSNGAYDAYGGNDEYDGNDGYGRYGLGSADEKRNGNIAGTNQSCLCPNNQ